jgi:hypothetical protein
VNRLDPTVSYYPKPGPYLRLAGLAAIVGGVVWPASLISLAGAATGCVDASCPADRGALAIAAIGPVLLALSIPGLELRAPRMPGLGDLVGDLSVGTGALLFVVSLVLGTIGLVGSGLLLLLIGSVIFGVVGYRNGARPRMASILVGIGAGSLLFFLVGGALGGAGAAGLETPSIFSLLVFSSGWVWLGADLLLARPLAIPERPDRR